MKIIFLLEHLNPTAPNTVMMNLIRHLCTVVDVMVVTVFPTQERSFRDVLTDMPVDIVECEGVWKSFQWLRTRKESGDIIHVNGYYPNLLGCLLKIVRKDAAVVSTCHSKEDDELRAQHHRSTLHPIKAGARLWSNLLFYRCHDRVCAVSSRVSDFLFSHGVNHVEKIPNGIDTSIFPEHNRHSGSDRISLAQIGHVAKVKNTLYSLQLVRYLAIERGIDCQFEIIGRTDMDVHYTKQVDTAIEALELQKYVTVVGAVSMAMLFDKLQTVDILLMPSYSEGLSLALLEAMYMEVAPVVSETIMVSELGADGDTVCTVDITSENDFDKVYHLIVSGQYKDMAKRARHKVAAELTVERMANRYLAVYRSLAGGSGVA